MKMETREISLESLYPGMKVESITITTPDGKTTLRPDEVNGFKIHNSTDQPVVAYCEVKFAPSTPTAAPASQPDC